MTADLNSLRASTENGERTSELHVRVVPNESVWALHAPADVAQLVGELLRLGHGHGITVEVDSRQRIRPGEPDHGASPIEAWELVLAFGAGYGAKVALRQMDRLADELVDALVAWVRQRWGSREVTGPAGVRFTTRPNPTHVRIYGPNGETLRDVLVEGSESEPPRARPREHLGEGY